MTVHHESCPICKGNNFSNHVRAKDHWVSKETFTLLKCHDCTLVFTQDAPDQESIGRYYEHDDYVSHTDTAKGLFFKVYHAVRNFMLGQKAKMVAKNATKGKLLEIGSGTGYFLDTMKTKGWEVVGVEPDSGAAKVAKTNFGFELLPTLSEVKYPDQSFEAVTMWHVLEHVHHLNEYLQRFHQLLSDNGALVIAVPNYTSWDAQSYKEYWAAYDVPKHLWHFSPASMEVLAANNGFTIDRHYMLPFDSFYISLLSAKNANAGLFGKIKALFVGKISYFNALFQVKKASSVVYILKKNNG